MPERKHKDAFASSLFFSFRFFLQTGNSHQRPCH